MNILTNIIIYYNIIIILFQSSSSKQMLITTIRPLEGEKVSHSEELNLFYLFHNPYICFSEVHVTPKPTDHI